MSIFLFCRNYPSWLFVDSQSQSQSQSGTNSSSDDVGLEHDRDCQDDEIVVVECSPPTSQPEGEEEDSEDEGWYSLSR